LSSNSFMNTGFNTDFTLPSGYVPRLNKIEHPSKKIYICDGAKFSEPGDPIDVEMDYNSGQDSEGGGFSDIGSYAPKSQGLNRSYANPTILSADWSSAAASSTPDPRVFGYRHGYTKPKGALDTYRFNAGFFDGHVETLGDLQSSNPVYWLPRGCTISPQNIQPDTDKAFGISILVAKYSVPE